MSSVLRLVEHAERTWANPTYRRRELRKVLGRIDREHDLACADCYGTANGGTDYHGQSRPCPTCHGYGIACPGCKGARFVRVQASRTPAGAPVGPTGTYLSPCPRCTIEINGRARYSEEREIEAMEAWWQENDVPF